MRKLREQISVECLEGLLACQHEDEQLDFKETHDQAEGYIELIKDIMAFANSNGGHIVFGVREEKDTKTFQANGLPDNISLDDLQLHRDAAKYLSDVPHFQVAHHVIQDRRFAVIYIAPSSMPISTIREGQKPTPDGRAKKVFDSGVAYERVSSENRPVKDFTAFFSKFLGRVERVESAKVDDASSRDRKPVGIKDSLLEAYNTVEQAFSAEIHRSWIPLGFDELNRKVHGLKPGDVLLVVGRPLVGKSLFASHICVESASRSGLNIGYFCPNSSLSEAGLRFLAAQAGVHMERLRRGRLHSLDWFLLSNALGTLAEARINIMDTPGISVATLVETAKKLSQEDRLDLLIVDDVHALGRASALPESPVHSLSTLKVLALELNIPILATFQLPSTTRIDQRPMLPDVGNIADLCDVVIGLHPTEFGDTATQVVRVEAILLKNRYGPVYSDSLILLESKFHQGSGVKSWLRESVWRILAVRDPVNLFKSGQSPLDYGSEAHQIVSAIGEVLPDPDELVRIVSDSFVSRLGRAFPQHEAETIAGLIRSIWVSACG